MAPRKRARTTSGTTPRAREFAAARADVTVVVDLGAGTLKLAVAEDGDGTTPIAVPNASARARGGASVSGSALAAVTDVNGLALRRAHDRGYCVNWELQREVLREALEGDLGVDARKCDLVITEAPFALPATREGLDAMVFEDLGFRRMLVATPAQLAKRYADRAEAEDGRDAGDLCVLARAGVVLDVGFSFTHATAICGGVEIARGIRRLNLGGKTLTNYLKELVSFRQWNMMDESVVIEDAKEKACYVADDVMAELEKCKVKRGGAVRREYVLPDGIHILRGYIKDIDEGKKDKNKNGEDEGENDEDDEDEDEDDDEDFGAKGPKRGKKKQPKPPMAKALKPAEPDHQVLTLVNERFMVPETLFHPSDIGARQCGVTELVTQAVENDDLCDAQRALCYLDVFVTGGCSLFPNFMERFERDLRPLISESYVIRVRRAKDPILAACLGGVDLARDRKFFEENAITKEEYLANKASIREAHQSLEFHPSVRTGRLRAYAREPTKFDANRIKAECMKLTPTNEREIERASE